MKKLLLPLTFICLLVSAHTVAQNTKKIDNSATTKVLKKDFKISKKTTVSRNSNRKAIKKISHREMIAKRKRIVGNY